MRSLWDDLSLVYAHEVLPDDLERELPSVTETWGDFNGGLETGSAVADTRVVKRETKRQRFVRIHAEPRPGPPRALRGVRRRDRGRAARRACT